MTPEREVNAALAYWHMLQIQNHLDDLRELGVAWVVNNVDRPMISFETRYDNGVQPMGEVE